MASREKRMSEINGIDYGPLTALIGVWKGEKGMDVAPEPDGTENNPYYETLTFTAIGDVTNAESQTLSVLHYRQIVQRQSNDEVFHDETGYWMWDPREKIVMHSLTIPRAVCVLAGAKYSGARDADGSVVIEVAASLGDENWQIIQSPFMQNNASTTAFRQTITAGNGKLTYSQTTMVDIYGKDDNMWRTTMRFSAYYEEMPGMFSALDAYHDLVDGSYFLQCSAGEGTEFYAEPPPDGYFSPATIRKRMKR